MPTLLSLELILSVRHGGEEQRWESSGSELASSEVGDFIIPR